MTCSVVVEMVSHDLDSTSVYWERHGRVERRLPEPLLTRDKLTM